MSTVVRCNFPTILLFFVFGLALLWHEIEVSQVKNFTNRVEIRSNNRRHLSSAIDINTGENLRTINGTIPEVSCAMGFYRPLGSTKLYRISGNRQDGCYPCPKGRYGETMGLTHPTCTAPCPVGTYSDEVGVISRNDCKKCPKGTFGKNRGLTTNECSGVCPKGRYTDKEGSTSCKICPKKYYLHQCPLDDVFDT